MSSSVASSGASCAHCFWFSSAKPAKVSGSGSACCGRQRALRQTRQRSRLQVSRQLLLQRALHHVHRAAFAAVYAHAQGLGAGAGAVCVVRPQNRAKPAQTPRVPRSFAPRRALAAPGHHAAAGVHRAPGAAGVFHGSVVQNRLGRAAVFRAQRGGEARDFHAEEDLGGHEGDAGGGGQGAPPGCARCGPTPAGPRPGRAAAARPRLAQPARWARRAHARLPLRQRPGAAAPVWPRFGAFMCA